MTLLEVYKEKNKDLGWSKKYSSLAKNNFGRFFEYTTTNFRTQKAFIYHFRKFLKVENQARNKWSIQKHHGQLVDKQRVVNLVQSKLFKKKPDGLYSRTQKGLLYTGFINSSFSAPVKLLINYIFLINGYYANRKNYILHRVKVDLLDSFVSLEGFTDDKLIDYAKELLSTTTLEGALQQPFFFLHSFYNDLDFLTIYLRASNSERNELAEYIENNLRTHNFACTISKKYRPAGNFNHEMLLDETRVFLLTLLFSKIEDINLNSAYEIFIENFKQNIFNINENTVLKYLHSNENVFTPIILEILEVEEPEVSLEEGKIEFRQPIKDVPEDFIDETSEVERQRIKSIFNIRKKQARILSGYKCELEKINNCKPIYFTSKGTGKNFLEVHHFVPREFRNDFTHSIEVFANLVSLCPRCHRQIHLAVDRERKPLINSLYNDRKKRLGMVGLSLELPAIHEYYKITI